MAFSDKLRNAVEASGLSRYRLCQMTRMEQAAMPRFMGGTGLTLDSVDALCETLGFELRPIPSKPVANKRRGRRRRST